MRRYLLLALVLMLVIGVVAVAPAVAKKPGKEVPFKATLGGDQVDPDPLADFEARCDEIDPVDADLVTTFEGTGRATHLGRVTVWAQHCTDTDTGDYGDGIIVLTAANGDELHGTYTNGLTVPDPAPPFFTFEDDFFFNDEGTGRFTFASGGGHEAGDFNFGTFEWSLTMEGTIAYSRK